jgi:hypothetical protein
MTIGTSAPPTGSTNSTPTVKLINANATVTQAGAPNGNHTPPATVAISRAANMAGRPGKTKGRPVISSCSRAKATMEPENATAPTSTVKPATASCAFPVDESAANSSSEATMTPASPPSPLKTATICGMAVIATRWAATTPIAAPTAIAAKIGRRLSGLSTRKTTTRATAAPAAPIQLPSRARRGEASAFSATMKQTAPSRYAIPAHVPVTGVSPRRSSSLCARGTSAASGR